MSRARAMLRAHRCRRDSGGRGSRSRGWSTTTATQRGTDRIILVATTVFVGLLWCAVAGAVGTEHGSASASAKTMAVPSGSCDADNPSCTTTPLAMRRRVWNPPEPLGPHESMYTKASVAVENTATLHVVVRNSHGRQSDMWDDFLDSLAVQGLEPSFVNAAAGLGSKETRQLASNLAKQPEDVVLFIGNPEDTVLLAEATELTRKFNAQECGVLFPATIRCRSRCAMDWPSVPKGHGQFMVADTLMAKANSFKLLVDSFPDLSSVPSMSESDQLIALFMSDRDFFGMKLDTNFSVFQPLYGYKDEWPGDVFSIDYEFHSEEDTRLRNAATQEHPGVLLGSGNTKLLTQLNNYMPLKWHPDTQSLTTKPIDSADPQAHVTIAFLVLPESPFLSLVLEGILNQDLLQSHRVSLVAAVVHSPHAHNYYELVQTFARDNKEAFESVTVVEAVHPDALHAAMALFSLVAETSTPTHVLYHTSSARLMSSTTMGELLSQDRRVVAPVLLREGALFSNFWGAATGDRDAMCFDNSNQCAAWAVAGECDKNEAYMKANCQKSCGVCRVHGRVEEMEYRRSADYMSIVQGLQTGLWAVPFVSEVFLATQPVFELMRQAVGELEVDDSSPLRFAFPLTAYIVDRLRGEKVKLFVDNRHFYGLLINFDAFKAEAVRPDLYLLEGNKQHWGDLYLHPDYEPYAKLDFVQGRCWDIYNFPLFSERFCKELIELSESYNLWSSGDNADERLKSGYEPVPTRDIHFYQMGFHKTWTMILREFVAPVAETQWVGYKLDGRHTLDFVVKYQPEGQPFLRKHHDASTFSLNVALNSIGVDFEGGGTRFTRQNCTVLDNKIGHALIHPGRLTHQHEGLYVTKGTRYIIVSFVDQV